MKINKNIQRIDLGQDWENVLKQNEYSENLTEFSEFWKTYQNSRENRSIPFDFFPGILRPVAIGAFAASLLFAGLIFRTKYIQNEDFKQINNYSAFITTLTKGNIQIKAKNSILNRNLTVQNAWKENQEIKTGKDSYCELEIKQKSMIRLLSNSVAGISQLAVAEEDDVNGVKAVNVRINLSIGEMLVKPNHLKPNESFIIQTPTAIISVTGTKFLVKVLESGITHVSVIEGTVVVKPIAEPTESITLNQNESVKISAKDETSLVPEKGSISQSDIEKLQTLPDMVVTPPLSSLKAINFNSNPSGAMVFIDGKYFANTPFQALLEKNKSYRIRLVKPDYLECRQDNFIARNSANFKLKPSSESGKIASTSSQMAPNINPGGLLWTKSIFIPNSDQESLIYQGSIYVADGNKLKIFSTNGSLIKAITIIPGGGNLTKPVFCDDSIYIGSDMGGVYSLSLNGKLNWQNTSAGKERYNASPAASFGIVAVPSLDKGIQIFSRDGKLLETISLNKSDSVYSTPLILNSGDLLIYATENGDITAYSIKTKTNQWGTNILSDRIVTPLLGNDSNAYIFYRASGTVAALNPVNGDVIWLKHYPQISKTTINPILSNDQLVIAGNQSVFVLDAVSGNEQASVRTEDKLTGILFSENSIIYSTISGTVFKYNIQQSKVEWTNHSGAKISKLLSDPSGIYALSPKEMIKIAK